MKQLSLWLYMGGYSMYIWPAYGVAFTVISMNLFSIWRDRVRARKMLRQWFNDKAL